MLTTFEAMFAVLPSSYTQTTGFGEWFAELELSIPSPCVCGPHGVPTSRKLGGLSRLPEECRHRRLSVGLKKPPGRRCCRI